MNPEKAAFHASVDQLNTLMADAQVPNELRLRMRYFFNHAKARARVGLPPVPSAR